MAEFRKDYYKGLDQYEEVINNPNFDAKD